MTESTNMHDKPKFSSATKPETVANAARESAAKEELAEQQEALNAAVEQIKEAANAIYKAFGSMGKASADVAKLKLVEGRERANEMGTQAEHAISEKPLIYMGVAFVAGWVVSKVIK